MASQGNMPSHSTWQARGDQDEAFSSSSPAPAGKHQKNDVSLCDAGTDNLPLVRKPGAQVAVQNVDKSHHRRWKNAGRKTEGSACAPTRRTNTPGLWAGVKRAARSAVSHQSISPTSEHSSSKPAGARERRERKVSPHLCSSLQNFSWVGTLLHTVTAAN